MRGTASPTNASEHAHCITGRNGRHELAVSIGCRRTSHLDCDLGFDFVFALVFNLGFGFGLGFERRIDFGLRAGFDFGLLLAVRDLGFA